MAAWKWGKTFAYLNSLVRCHCPIWKCLCKYVCVYACMIYSQIECYFLECWGSACLGHGTRLRDNVWPLNGWKGIFIASHSTIYSISILERGCGYVISTCTSHWRRYECIMYALEQHVQMSSHINMYELTDFKLFQRNQIFARLLKWNTSFT